MTQMVKVDMISLIISIDDCTGSICKAGPEIDGEIAKLQEHAVSDLHQSQSYRRCKFKVIPGLGGGNEAGLAGIISVLFDCPEILHHLVNIQVLICISRIIYQDYIWP